MIRFILKGILRDKNRSMLPIAVVTIGVTLTVLLSGYIRGAMGSIIDQNARFETGHVKIMSRAYAENKDQLPNDLALLGVDTLMQSLQKTYPNMQWEQRIKFGGLIDVPDAQGNTKGQGPAAGMAIDLLSGSQSEINRLNITSSIVTGNIPKTNKEVLIGHDFFEKLNLKVKDTITYIGTTMNGSMTFENFIVSGTIRFGIPSMDKGALIADISDVRRVLDMENAIGEILGYFNSGAYFDEEAGALAINFNTKYKNNPDEFVPVMYKLKDQNNLASYLDYVDIYSVLFVAIFVIAMSIVLWNTGLLGGLRRYQEYGIRLALGESKGHIYSMMVAEAVLIGLIGSVFGTIIGLGLTYYMQKTGINIESMIQDATMLMPTVLRSKITPDLFYIGFIPGLLAMVFGTMLSGIGIYKRETATLFKELEV